MATLDDELRRMREMELRNQQLQGLRSQGFAFDPNASPMRPNAERARIYSAARGGGYSPEVSNIFADHGVIRQGQEMQGPMPDGSAGYRERGIVANPAARRAPEYRDPDPIGLTRNSSYGEAMMNQNKMAGALAAGNMTQRLRDQSGQAMTREEQYRRRTADTARIEGLEARGQDRDLARDLAAYRVQEQLAARPQAPALEITPIEGGGQALTYGNTMEVVGGKSEGSVTVNPDGTYKVVQPDGKIEIVQPGSDRGMEIGDFMRQQKIADLMGQLSDPKLKPDERRRLEAQLQGFRGGGGAPAGAGAPAGGAAGAKPQYKPGDMAVHPQHGRVKMGEDGKWYPAGN